MEAPTVTDSGPGDLHPALLRGLTSARMSRRGAGRLLGAAGMAVALAGCGGIAKGGKAANTDKDAVAAFWDKAQQTDSLHWANWALYLDTSGKSGHPSLDLFTQRTGIDVKYTEAITSYPEWFAKVQAPISSGQYSGFDLGMVDNSLYFWRFRDLGLMLPLDQSRLTNFHRYAGHTFQHESFDPGNVFTVPWQAGFTGIGYNPKYTGREITSWSDLQDPRFKGKIGMFNSNEELPNAALLAIGVDPGTSTKADWKRAADWLQKQKPLVRNYYGQNYIQALATGDLWISMAWSGDIFQQNLSGSDLKFVIPDEGAELWSDNFAILKYCKNPVGAMKLMDFYYQPEIAAMVTEYVNYVTPVPAARTKILDDAKTASKPSNRSYLHDVATSFATFPTQQVYDNVKYLWTPKPGPDLDAWNALFEPIYTS
jgi:spermidine/putrescine transport system substrate-binding protein